MRKFHMCTLWLNIVSIIFIVFGIALALFNQTSIFNYLFNNNINPSFWGNMKLSPEILRFQQWIYAVLGATCAGWGALICFIVNNGFKKKESWTWSSILFSITIWFLFDTLISLYFKIYFNALFNVALILSVFIPLIITRRYFKTYQIK